ncbi:hypothetical protein NEIG_00303 [Nematocida sp. ERTm5]|nr:hypothetical protein NEIG_00303 [Nematocida sp. ERTm5]
MNNGTTSDGGHKDTLLESIIAIILGTLFYSFYYVIRLTPYIALLCSTVILYNFFWSGIPVTDDIKYIFVGKSDFMYKTFLFLTVGNFFSSICWIWWLRLLFGDMFNIIRTNPKHKNPNKPNNLFNIAKVVAIIFTGAVISKKVYYSNLMTLYGIATIYRGISVFITLFSWLVTWLLCLDFQPSLFWNHSGLNVLRNWHHIYIAFDIIAMVILYMASDALANAASPDYMNIVVSGVNKV